MARRTSYGFQKQQQDLKKEKKREEKAEKKRLKAEAVHDVTLPADSADEAKS